MKTIPFNAEQAKAGRPLITTVTFRPLLLIHHDDDKAWVRGNEGFHWVASLDSLGHAADPAPGHNPQGLDEWTVGCHEGWRLLEKEEIVNRTATEDILYWTNGCQEWDWPAIGNDLNITYRTKRPSGYFLPAKPVTRPLRPDELEPIVLIQKRDEEVYVTTPERWTNEDIRKAIAQGSRWSRSLDGPWLPFTTEEKP